MGNNNETKGINRKDLLTFWGTCLLYFIFVSVAVSVYTPLHIFPRRYINKFTFSLLYHARYNVYVRRPGEPVFQIYTLQDGKPVLDDLRPGQPKYLFGLKRDYKVVAIEVNTIARDTPAIREMPRYQVTMPVDGNLADYINPDSCHFTDVHYTNVRYLTGKYLVTIEKPVDWNYMRQKGNKSKALSILAINVTH